MLESQFQSKLIKELKKLFPGCIIMKSDSGYLQGIPDLPILGGKQVNTKKSRVSIAQEMKRIEKYFSAFPLLHKK